MLLYAYNRYNNQWMVVDYKAFVPNAKKLEAGLLYVLEQIPSVIPVFFASYWCLVLDSVLLHYPS